MPPPMTAKKNSPHRGCGLRYGGNLMEMEHYVFLVLMFLVSTFINVTAAGWLALQMGRFIWMNLLEDPRFISKSHEKQVP